MTTKTHKENRSNSLLTFCKSSLAIRCRTVPADVNLALSDIGPSLTNYSTARAS